MPENKTLKNAIREIKFKTGLTQKQIAGRLGIQPTYLSDAINGRVPYSDNLKEKIYEIYSDCFASKEEILKSPSTDADILSLAGKNEFLMAYLREKDKRIEELLQENIRLKIELSQARQLPKEPLVMPAGHSVTHPRISTSKPMK